MRRPADPDRYPGFPYPTPPAPPQLPPLRRRRCRYPGKVSVRLPAETDETLDLLVHASRLLGRLVGGTLDVTRSSLVRDILADALEVCRDR